MAGPINRTAAHPNPGERPDIRDAWALTLRVILLF
jgi:hypothetical protein